MIRPLPISATVVSCRSNPLGPSRGRTSSSSSSSRRYRQTQRQRRHRRRNLSPVSPELPPLLWRHLVAPLPRREERIECRGHVARFPRRVPRSSHGPLRHCIEPQLCNAGSSARHWAGAEGGSPVVHPEQRRELLQVARDLPEGVGRPQVKPAQRRLELRPEHRLLCPAQEGARVLRVKRAQRPYSLLG